jgi:hypothetical protein
MDTERTVAGIWPESAVMPSANGDHAPAPLPPSSVRIGLFEYAVVREPVVKGESTGGCSSYLQRLYIDPGLTPVGMADALLHETLHAIYRITTLPGAKDDDEEEERIVQALAVPLLQVIHDNPQLLEFLQAATRGVGR